MNTVPAETRESALWATLRLPVQVLLLGLIVLLLIWLSTKIHVPLFDDISKSLAGANVLETIVALLVFLVGLAFAGFLWWVVGRYFALVSSGKEISSLKDLPMGLPEGSIRSLLAMIVAVVGIPLLVFSEAMHLNSTVAGYLNGIITGVFGFYFGTRSAAGASSTQALNQIVDAKSRADQAEDERDQAVAAAAAAQGQADAATKASGFAGTVATLNREVGVASSILDEIVPVIPPGILPSGLAKVVNDAKTALDTVKGVTGGTVSDAQGQLLQTAITAITGSSGSSSSLGSLIKAAAPMLTGVLPGVGAVTALTALLSVGYKLGSAEFNRWRARVLAAPLAHGLIEFGTVTPDDAHAALQSSPLFLKAFAEEQDAAGFDMNLADTVLRDNAVDLLWQKYGVGQPGGHPALFTDRSQVEAGLTEFNQVLLAARSAADMPNGLPPAVTTALSQAKDPQIRAAATTAFTQAQLNQIVNAASKASTPAANAPKDAHAAFDALVTLVGKSRQKGDDLVGAIAEATT